MGEYRFSGHAVWDIKYHLIWITKYRYKILRGEVAERAREVIRQVCQAREVSIIRGAISPDHVHMLVAAAPQLAPAKLVQYVKGRSSRRLQEEFPHLRKRYWGQHLWARGYFCATVGAVDEKTIMEYIESQKWEQDDQGFRITAPPEP
jgi:REP-associated tyrosine transposase